MVEQIRTYLEALMLTDDHPLTPAEGEVLFREGDASDGRMYVVRSGSVRLQAGGRRLEDVGPGGMVGEMALIDPAPRSATAIAGTGCAVTPVTSLTFRELVKRVPGLALEVMREMARRLRRANLARAAKPAARAAGRRKPAARRKPAPRRKPAARRKGR